MVKILQYLPDCEINNMRLSCTFFRNFIDSGIVWRLRISPHLLERGRRLHSKFCKLCNGISEEEPCVWKQIYVRFQLCEEIYLDGKVVLRLKPANILVEHSSYIVFR